MRKRLYIYIYVLLVISTVISAVILTKQEGNNPTNFVSEMVEQTENKVVTKKNQETEPQSIVKTEAQIINETTYSYNISESDKILMAKVVYAEARGECFEGQVAVAAVILNRYYYGGRLFDRSSIYSVVTQKYQFASIVNVTTEMLDKCPSCMQAVEEACRGVDPTRKVFPETGALYFYAPDEVSGYEASIREGIKYISIGNHNFHASF